MTKREFYQAIVSGEINDEVQSMAAKYIEDMDASNEKRQVKAHEKALEREKEKAPIREAVFACITADAKTATDLINEAGVELKPQAIPSLLKPLVEDGSVVKVDIKVKGKGTQRGYVRG